MIRSYLLIKLAEDEPGRFEPGMIIDIREAYRPLGAREHPPFAGVIYTDKSVGELQHLLKPAGIWHDTATTRPWFQVTRKRDRRVDVDNMPERIPPGVKGRLFRLLAGARVGERLNRDGQAHLLSADLDQHEMAVA